MTLPPGTVSKLQASHPEGTKHQAKLELAMEMLGNGIPASAVEVTLQEKFPSAAQREIIDVITWAAAHNPGPSAEPGSRGFAPSLRNGFFHRDPDVPWSCGTGASQAQAQRRRACVRELVKRAFGHRGGSDGGERDQARHGRF